ncbi:hypothetical protein CMMCA001_16360 [Clavibacter michiganensis subsp. michiganensis]|nr:hypothetical protein CMMCA001_16360 [Clavibacter michiganensis subsp. michiganensis]
MTRKRSASAGIRCRNMCELDGYPWSSRSTGASAGPASRQKTSRSSSPSTETETVRWWTVTIANPFELFWWLAGR